MHFPMAPALLAGDDFGAAAGGAALVGMTMFLMMIWLAVIAVLIIGLWKMFAKAGKPGWAAIVPIYNIIVMLEIVGRPLWWIALFCIPFVNFVMAIIVLADLAKSFGKSAIFVLLFLLGGIGYLILGFGSARYIGPAAAPGGALSTNTAV